MSDRAAGTAFLVAYALYILLYGFIRGRSLWVTPLDTQILTLLIPIFFTDSIKTVWESIASKQIFKASEDLRKVTVIIASRNGSKTLPGVIADLTKRFHPYQIIVSSNGSTDTTVSISQKHLVRYLNVSESIGKVEAINQAMDLVETPYTLILDDDTHIGSAIIPTNLLDQGYRGVAFRVMPKIQTWISRLQAYEYRKSMDISRTYHNDAGTVQSISGAIGLFHTQVLKNQISTHSKEFSGEDLQRTLLIHLSRPNKGVVIADSVVETYVPTTLLGLVSQRIYGWYPGHFANTKNFIKLIVKPSVPLKLRFEALYSIMLITLIDPLRVITLPILLFSPAYFTLFYLTYVLIEFIPYIVLGRKDPVWVWLVSPIYGLINFVTRIASAWVFVYRRLVHKFGKLEQLDGYREANFAPKLAGLGTTFSALATIFAGYSYLSVFPTLTNNTQVVITQQIDSGQAQVGSVSQELTSFKTLTLRADYEYEVQPGDSAWSVSYKTLDYYANRPPYSHQSREQLAHYLATETFNVKLRPGDKLRISYVDVLNASTKIENDFQDPI